MKIAIYYHKIEAIGGVEKSIIELCRTLSNAGHKVTFIFSDIKSDFNMLDRINQYADIKHISYNSDETYDIVFYETIHRAGEIKALQRKQIINNNWEDCNVNKKMVPICDEYIAVGNECKCQAERIINKKIKVVPNIINVEEIKKLSNIKIEFKNDCLTFVTVSRISFEKGFDRIIIMLKELDKKNIEYKWYIIGEGEPSIVKQLSQFKNIILLGKQDNPYPYIKNADYLVMLSSREAQCLVMFESLILGTPVIVTDFGTALETVKENMGFILKKDMSNLDIDKIVNSKFNFKYKYPNVEQQWINEIKPIEKKNNKFTILIPNYNNSEYLEKCLKSVLNQTYKNYEIIFVDDMSEDNSVEIAKKILTDKNHKIIELKSKRYNGGARNVGIVEADSDYILSIDSDDWLVNNQVLEKINNVLTNEDVLFLGFQQIRDGELFNIYIPEHPNRYSALVNNVCAIWTKVVKTDIMKQCLFSEGTLMEDKVQHFRVCNKMQTFKCFPEITHYWNRGNKHSVSTARNTKWNSSIYRFIADLIDFYYECDEEFKPYIKERIEGAKKNAQKNIFKQE